MKRNSSNYTVKDIFIFCIVSGLFSISSIAQQIPEQFREPFSNSFPIRKDQHLELKAYADKLLEDNIKTSILSFKPEFFSIEDYENSLYPYRKN
ncbi:MAG: hypothetical protein IPJ37_23880 [Bacteroidales bacterium]|nr:hypothetical protein [Bacteroidales bacterium]